MEEGVVTVMADFLSQMSSIGTTVLTWVGEVAETVVGTPILLLPAGMAIFGVAIGVFKSLRH